MKSINLLSLVLVAGLIASCSQDKATQLSDLKAQQAELTKQIAALEAEIGAEGAPAVTVRMKEVGVKEIAPRAFDHYVKTQGLVEAEDNILVSSRGMGVITQVTAKEGQMVSKGQTLAQIDNSLILQNIDGIKTQLELATSVYDRQKKLWDQKIGSEIQYLQAKTQKESLEKQLAMMEEQNNQTRIKSPINGVLDELSLKVGQNISPGMPAARVINNSELKVVASVSEAYITVVKTGDKVKVTIPDLNNEIEAKVTFVGRHIDPLSRTFILEAELPSSADLRPNMTALIKIVYASYPSVLTVPVNTVQDIKGEKVVYIASVDGNNTVARRKVVTVDGVFDGQAQVKGLAAGDKVITAGFQGLTDGQFLKLQ